MKERFILDPRARSMLKLALPALLIGIGSSGVLVAVVGLASELQRLIWIALPRSLGIAAHTPWWTVAMLTLTGIVVGLIVRYAPGHAGPDPATEGLIGPPLAPAVLPGLLVALVLGLAGGVSLGPENPITAINIALAVALGRRLLPSIAPASWVTLAAAGTIGALFGTPVAAALILSQTVGNDIDRPLWDRLFAPLVAAGAGAVTTALMVEPDFSLALPAYRGAQLHDLLGGSLVVIVAVVLGLGAVWVFPRAHRLFQSLKHPVLMLGAGGFLLGLLGVLGGEITLFKGLAEMKLLALTAADRGAGGLALILVCKLAALVIAAACGFRGGRIFPAVFVGVALGLLMHALVPMVPVSLAVACAILGLVLVVTRDGWLSLFMAAAVVPDLRLLPVLCLVILPAWLLLAGRPLMLIPHGPSGR